MTEFHSKDVVGWFHDVTRNRVTTSPWWLPEQLSWIGKNGPGWDGSIHSRLTKARSSKLLNLNDHELQTPSGNLPEKRDPYDQ